VATKSKHGTHSKRHGAGNRLSNRIAQQPASVAVPEGYALVPIDATRRMIDAAIAVDEDGYDAMHKAMIAAAPHPVSGDETRLNAGEMQAEIERLKRTIDGMNEAHFKVVQRMAYIEENGPPEHMRQIHPTEGEPFWSYDCGTTKYITAADAIDAAIAAKE